MGVAIQSLAMDKRKIVAEHPAGISLGIFSDADTPVNVVLRVRGAVQVVAIDPAGGSVVQDTDSTAIAWSQNIKAGQSIYLAQIVAAKRPYTSTGHVVAETYHAEGNDAGIIGFVTGSAYYEEPRVIPSYGLGLQSNAQLWTPHRIEPGDTMQVQLKSTAPRYSLWTRSSLTISGPSEITLVSSAGADWIDGATSLGALGVKNINAEWICHTPAIALIRSVYSEVTGGFPNLVVERVVGVGMDVPIIGPPVQPPGPIDGEGGIPWWMILLGGAGLAGLAYGVSKREEAQKAKSKR